MSVSAAGFGDNNSNWDLSEWDALRDDAATDVSHQDTSIPSDNHSPADEPVVEPHTEAPAEAPAEPSLPQRLTLDDLPEADHQAREFFTQNGADTVETAFALANILHTNRNVSEASRAYHQAYDLHPKEPNYYPLPQTLLQVSLLCRLKAGLPIPPEELLELRALNIPFANYIDGTAQAWSGAEPQHALNTIGNAYDEFHTGEEIDSIALEIARRASPSPFEPNADEGVYGQIPRKLFMYWDKNPPEEIQKNFELHRNIPHFETHFFNKEEAAEWLYQHYGIEARTIFLSARHPAEAADFLRVHVIQLLGGWWMDADIRVKNSDALKFMATRTAGATFFLTNNNVVHNDFFGSVANNDVLTDCLLSLYRNCYLHHGLFIAYKTGPGVFNRALNRIAHRSLLGNPPAKKIEIFDHHKFNDMIEEFDTPYKQQLPSWYTA
ncbi:glycosyltransferase family 32 protein [Neokomagataea thailandica]|uniref:Uncharacterized protein n=1 Tax=Neokomagataea tanensis NBRC 106556 TaxID=1223519 RepID=A0ABQ0QG56_9PROT|nr:MULTISPECIES: hypothetical protein [Neokomagataea]GBR43645.1 hypothetical protein AA106556_0164 [Neokomagataea tanensis NBRC 106556]